MDNLVYYLAVQPTDDVAYKLSDLVKRIILHKPSGSTFFGQNSYSGVQHAHFIPIEGGVGKRGIYKLVLGDRPRQYSFGTTLRFTGPVSVDFRQ